MEVSINSIRNFRMSEITLEIRPEGMVIFNRQDSQMLDETLDMLSQLDDPNNSIKEFLDGRKNISLIIGKEIYCG